MKLSLNWIKKYVDLPKNLTPKQLSYDLTMRTVEVEEIEDLALKYRGIVVGKVLSVEKHSNADSLKVCKVDVGKEKIYQIVCGGTNVAKDQLVIVALPGSYVRWHGEGDLVLLEETKLRGEISQGMICAASELMLDDIFIGETDHMITDITKYGFKVGENIADVLGLNDYIIDIDNKSLTNRPDLWSHYGMARELAAIYNVSLKNIIDEEFVQYLSLDEKPEYSIEIEDEDLCKRFVGIVADNVEVKESPLELKIALHNIGENPINLLVDISNYIMFSLGQPTHFYDYTHVKNGLIIRRAKEGEKLITLGDEELNLSPNNLVIADHEKVLGLAGIIGGKNDSISPDTKKIVIEMANFNAINVRTTAQEYNQRTEASIRFEKQIDPQRIDLSYTMLFTMLRKYYPELRILEFKDVRAEDLNLKKEVIIEIKQSFINNRLGKIIESETILDYLDKLGFQVEEIDLGEDCLYKIKVPSWRATGDVSLKEDIVEEIGRMEGYENFDVTTHKVELNYPIIQNDQQFIRKLKEYLSFRNGMQEIILYPFIHEKYIDAMGLDKTELLTLADPPSPETKYIRKSLIPGILSAIETNLKNYDEFRLYEVGKVYSKNKMEEEGQENLPIHNRRLSGAIVGKDAEDIFFATKGIIEEMAHIVQIQNLELAKLEELDYIEKNAYLNIICNNRVVGTFGLLSKKTMVKAGIKNTNVCIFDINLDKIEINKTRENDFKELPQYPLVKVDLSMIVDKKVTWDEIKEIALKTADEVIFVEEYKGEQVPENKKSIMFHMIYIGREKTLTDKDIKEKTDKIISDFNEIGALIRS